MKAPKTLNELLDQQRSTKNSLSAYRQKSEKFIQIQAILVANLPANMAQNLLVSNYKNSIIYFETHSAAMATAFKMHQSQLLSAFRRDLDPALVTIELKVSPNATRTASRVKQSQREQEQNKKTKALPEQAAEIFTAMAEQSEGPLKEKLLKLAKHKKSQG